MTEPTSYRQSIAGFTLLELSVVLLVLSLMAAGVFSALTQALRPVLIVARRLA